jgi:histidyl-tRNA synthetase
VAVIVGPDELAQARVTLRRLRSEADQEVVARADLVSRVRGWLAP